MSHGCLSGVPSGQDRVSRSGSRTQSLSSWAYTATSYIVAMARGSLDPGPGAQASEETSEKSKLIEITTVADVTKEADSYDSVLFGTKMSASTKERLTTQQKRMFKEERLHYIDLMNLSCHALDMYLTMHNGEKIIYHLVLQISQMRMKYSMSLTTLQTMAFGYDTRDVVINGKQSKLLIPPTTMQQQTEQVTKLANVLGDEYRYPKKVTAGDSALRNPFRQDSELLLSLSKMLTLLCLYPPPDSDISKLLSELVLIPKTWDDILRRYEYMNFRNQNNDNKKIIALLKKRVLDVGTWHKHDSDNITTQVSMLPEHYTMAARSYLRDQEIKNDLNIKSYSTVATPSRVPIRYTVVSNVPGTYERANPYVTTPTYTSLAERLMDRSPATTLGPLVRRAMIRDPGSVLALIKTLMGVPASAMDVAPLARMLNQIASMEPDACKYDLTPYQFFRDYRRIDHSIHIVSNVAYSEMRIVMMYLDDFVDYISGHIPMAVVPGYSPQDIDQEWIAIPITNDMLRSDALVPYVISFLDSRITNGTVNWLMRGEIFSLPTSAQGVRQGVLYNTIPAANLHIIPGVTKFCLVLIDQHSRPDWGMQVEIEQMQVVMYNKNAAVVAAQDFSPAWFHFYDTHSLNRVRNSYNKAYRYYTMNNLLPGVQALAMAIAAESYLAQRPGMYIHPVEKITNLNDAGYDYQTPLAGGYWLGSSDNMVPTLHSNGGKTHVLAGSLDALIAMFQANGTDITSAIMGYNGCALSAFHLLSNGVHQLAENPNQQLLNNIPTVILNHVGDGPHMVNVVGYHTTQASSLHRLATSLGLYQRDLTPIEINSVPSILAWTHMHATSIQATTSWFLIKNNIPLHMWCGVDAYANDSFAANIVDSIKREAFIDTVVHNDTLPQLCTIGNDPTIRTNIEDYYSMYTTHHDFWSSTPTHITLLLQWHNKIIQPDYIAEYAYDLFYFNGYEMHGYPIKNDDCVQRVLALTTIDFDRYAPQSIFIGDFKGIHGQWLETVQYLTMSTTAPNIFAHRDTLQFLPSVYTPFDITIQLIDTRRQYIRNTWSLGMSADIMKPKVTGLMWPDPPPALAGNFESPALTIPSDTTAEDQPVTATPTAQAIRKETAAQSAAGEGTASATDPTEVPPAL